jgi:hypothetical protein
MPLIKQEEYRVKNRYELATDLYTIDGIGAFGDLANSSAKAAATVIGAFIIEPITRVGEQLTGLYRHKSDLDYGKEEMQYDYFRDSDDALYEAEKDKLIIIVIAVCFLMLFVFNFK